MSFKDTPHEVAETWTQQTPAAKEAAIARTKDMDARGIARVALAIDGFYGARHGPIKLRVFLQELIASYPPETDLVDETTLVQEAPDAAKLEP